MERQLTITVPLNEFLIVLRALGEGYGALTVIEIANQDEPLSKLQLRGIAKVKSSLNGAMNMLQECRVQTALAARAQLQSPETNVVSSPSNGLEESS